MIISPPCLLLCIYGSPFAVRYIYWASVRYSGALYSVMALEGAEEQLKSTFIDVHIILGIIFLVDVYGGLDLVFWMEMIVDVLPVLRVPDVYITRLTF